MCCEIGVYEGEFSRQMFDILKPKTLVLIDPFEKLIDPISNEEYYPNWGEQRTVYSNDNCLSTVNSRFSVELQNNSVLIDKNLSTNTVNNYEDDFFNLIRCFVIYMNLFIGTSLIIFKIKEWWDYVRSRL